MTDGLPIAPHYEVIVIGGGPTGLTIANLLAHYGTECLLVERNPTTVSEPRAVSIDDESLRTMQAIGLVDTVLSKIEAGYGSEYRSPRGKVFLTVAPEARPYGFPRRNAFRQPTLEAQLRAHLDHSEAETRFGWTLLGFEQNAARVHVELCDPSGTTHQISCRYLVGADGASSLVRKKLGIDLDGETFAERWLIVDLEDSPAPSRETIVFCDPRRPCVALPGPNRTRRFEFKLHPGETDQQILDDEVVRPLLDSHGAAPASRITRKVVYTFHARVAQRWAEGRVFLAGDACHLTPPFAGQGMNSGIRDAHNLAWKLACVCAGRLPPALLHTYADERIDHVREMIALALRMGRIMGPRSNAHAVATRAFFHGLNIIPGLRSFFGEMKYKPKPRFASGFILPDRMGRRRTLVGRLLPQPLVQPAVGPPVPLDDLLGDGFALLSVTDDASALRRVSEQLNGIGLAHRVVSLSRTLDGEGVFDPSGVIFAAAYSQPDRAILVRPDRYVFTTFPLSGSDRAVAHLASMFRDRLTA